MAGTPALAAATAATAATAAASAAAAAASVVARRLVDGETRGGRWWLWGWGKGRSVGVVPPPVDPNEPRLRSILDPLLNCRSRRSGGDARTQPGVLARGETAGDGGRMVGTATAFDAATAVAEGGTLRKEVWGARRPAASTEGGDREASMVGDAAALPLLWMEDEPGRWLLIRFATRQV